MQFPEYQVPMAGNGLVIGLNAVIHVVLSHGVAIGVFALIVLTDWRAGLRPPPEAAAWDSFNRRLLKALVITVTTVGALTGVGIWFTTTALAPRGIASMLRVFFWPWFTEWIVFVLEVVGLFIYYRLWDGLGGPLRRWRVRLGAAYVGLAVASAVLITGILGFMLTPGNWPSDPKFREAFFNPSFLPQLGWRLAVGVLLGALMALALATWWRGDEAFRRQAARLFGGVILLSTAVLLATVLIYFQAVPAAFRTQSRVAVLTSRLSQTRGLVWGANAAAVAFLAGTGVVALRRRAGLVRWLVVPALALAIGGVAEIERIREFVRGPYLMPGYMYANTALLKEGPRLRQRGLLAESYWYAAAYPRERRQAAGAYLFSRQCAACHTIGGINDIGGRVRGRSEDGLNVILDHTQDLVPFMPPFSGTPEERRILARFLYEVGQGRVRMESYARHIPAAQEAGGE